MIAPSLLLHHVPTQLRDPLLDEYRGLISNFLEEQWRSAGIDAGRFCEVSYTILDGATQGGRYAAAPSKPPNFPEACRALESRPPTPTGDRSLRIMIPRSLPPIYEIRNNRDVGHVGGDVRPNKMDAQYVVGSCTFVLTEFIRVFHNCTIAEAQIAVDALVERKTPLIWTFDGGKRVLDGQLSASEKVLLLIASEPGWVDINSLFRWCKYTNLSMFKSKVLADLDRDLAIEYDRSLQRCMLTPLGAKRAAQLISSRT